ncbi:MAG: beta-galactosidase [Verrucomicrobia bacterium]|nr:beta-galactosidase [Verrucomicrobiota bacterium]MBV8486085.1 beta-galactosidase [Verrucomicrobiota bacterium]
MRISLAAATLALGAISNAFAWAPVAGHMMTKYADSVNPNSVWPEYPRPQLVRSAWTNLDGLWDFAITGGQAGPPTHWEGQILLPFPLESSLSGICRPLRPDQVLWYKRQLELSRPANGTRVLLHFEAVNYIAVVTVNGKVVGEHQGGYDPFTFDITDALVESKTQNVVVKVINPTGEGNYPYQPRGKLSLTPGDIFYTDASGIWQTVWLESVPASYIADLLIVPDIDTQKVFVTVQVGGTHPVDPQGRGVTVEVLDGVGKTVSTATGTANTAIASSIKNPHLWSPDDPYLYGLRITYGSDVVTSYLGMRKVDVRKDPGGSQRIFVNNEPLFLFGPLDQGFWPDGIYLAPSDAALRSDLEYEKSIGCNMVRKHVKVEPRRWYYWADKLGLLVWQDFPSPQDFREKRGASDRTRPQDQAVQIEKEMKAMVETHRNHPCIMMWVAFNEGWGQYDTIRIAHLFKSWDPTRLVDDASGWNDLGAGDVLDDHTYPWPRPVPPQPDRASVLGEFGGAGFPIPGHLWNPQGKVSDEHDLPYAAAQQQWILGRLETLRDLAAKGLSAAVYTQLSDVENEVNGFLTYDRTTVQKVSPDVVQRAARKLYAP